MALLDQRQRGRERQRGGETDRRGAERGGESDKDRAERYRVAAEDALQQLDWTIGYLHGIRKTGISQALAKNRYYIRRSLMRKPDVQDPSEQTAET